MTVKKGDKIYAIDEDRILEVEGLWGNASKFIDFSGIYTTTNLVDSSGNVLFGGRGFRFQDENIIWRKIK